MHNYKWKLSTNKKRMHTCSDDPGVKHMVTWFISTSVWQFWRGGCSNCCRGDNSTLGGLLYSNGMTRIGVRRWGLKTFFLAKLQPQPRGKGNMVAKWLRSTLEPNPCQQTET